MTRVAKTKKCPKCGKRTLRLIGGMAGTAFYECKCGHRKLESK